MIKRIVVLFLFIILFCCGCAKKEVSSNGLLIQILDKGYITVGVKTDSYPFGFLDKNGKYAGYDVDLAKLIAKELLGDESKVKFIPVTASDRITTLYSNQVDMLIATMSITPTREQILDFSTSYYVAGQAVLVKKYSRIKSLRDLNGKKVIIVFGSTAEKSLRAAVPNVRILGYKTYNDAYKAFKAGKADAIVSDNSILLGFVLKDNSLQLLPKKYTKEPYAVAFKKDANSADLINSINGIITQAGRSGLLRKMQNSYGIK